MLLVNKNIALKFNTNSHSSYGAKLSIYLKPFLGLHFFPITMIYMFSRLLK